MANEQILKEIRNAVSSHGLWKFRLLTAIAERASDATPEAIKCDHLCEFGKWLYGPAIDDEMKRGQAYLTVKRLHTEFHECASIVMELALAGREEVANILVDGEYTVKSHKLIRALNKWNNELRGPRAEEEIPTRVRWL